MLNVAPIFSNPLYRPLVETYQIGHGGTVTINYKQYQEIIKYKSPVVYVIGEIFRPNLCSG